MENNINKIVKLSNGKKYLILKQAMYNKETYYMAVEVNDDDTEIVGNFVLLHESLEDNQKYIEIVNDPKVMELLFKYIKLPEVIED